MLITYCWYIHIGLQREQVNNLQQTVEIKVFVDGRIWIRIRANFTNRDQYNNYGSEMPKRLWILKIRIRNTGNACMTYFIFDHCQNNFLFSGELLEKVVPYSDSLGMNEQELPNLHSLLTTGSTPSSHTGENICEKSRPRSENTKQGCGSGSSSSL